MSAGKVVAIGCGAAVVVAAALVAGGVFWVRAHQGELVEAGKGAFKEGAHFGEGRDAAACVAEAERRLPSLGGALDEATNKVFLEGCLKTATLPAGFCDGIPARNDILASVHWAGTRCTGVPAASQARCTRLIGAVQERCQAGR